MSWQISIEKITNAFLLHWEDEVDADENEEPRFIKKTMAFEGKESFSDDLSDRESLVRALDQIVDYFNLSYHKHYRPEDRFIKISLVPGDKYWDEGNSENFIAEEEAKKMLTQAGFEALIKSKYKV